MVNYFLTTLEALILPTLQQVYHILPQQMNKTLIIPLILVFSSISAIRFFTKLFIKQRFITEYFYILVRKSFESTSRWNNCYISHLSISFIILKASAYLQPDTPPLNRASAFTASRLRGNGGSPNSVS